MKTTKNLILYRDFENEQLFYDFTWVMENYQNEYYNKEDVEGLFYECLKKLMEPFISPRISHALLYAFSLFTSKKARKLCQRLPENPWLTASSISILRHS